MQGGRNKSTPLEVIPPERAEIGVAPRDAGAEIQNFFCLEVLSPDHSIYVRSFIEIGRAVSEP